MNRLILVLGTVLLIWGSARAEDSAKPTLVHFALTGDAKVADQLPPINIELSVVLEGSKRFNLIAHDELSAHLIMDPLENLAFCAGEVGCIVDMATDVKARWILFGDIKPSFDGSKTLVHLQLLDVPGRKLEKEEFGQYDKGDQVARQTGDLVRKLLGIPIPTVAPKPEPKPLPKVATRTDPELEKPGKKPKSKLTLQQAPPPAKKPWTNPLTLTAAGIGVAALATATALGVLSQNKVSDAEEQAVLGFPLDAKDLYSEAKELALGANIAFGVGGAALATAVILFVLDITEDTPAATPTVACTGTGCSAGLWLRF